MRTASVAGRLSSWNVEGLGTTSARAQRARARRALTLRVRGHCMSRLAADGVLIEVSRRRSYWPGDVVTFRSSIRSSNGAHLLHRLIAYRPRARTVELVTRGDGCSTWDTRVALVEVIGRVSGGDCAPCLIRLPFNHRARAVMRFIPIVLARLASSLS
jgi:hypothetical protein